MLDINSEIVIGIITAAITAYAAVANFSKKYKGEYVTKERQTWRTEIRKRFEEVAYTTDVSELKKFMVFMNTRINPYDIKDIEIIKNLKAIEKELRNKTKEGLDQEWEQLSVRLSLLLKHDWERIKKESKSSSYVFKLFYYFVLTIVCNQLLQLNNIEQLTYGFVTLNSSISRVFILTVIVVCLGNSLYFVMCKFIKLINVYKFKMMIKCKKKEKKDTEEYMKKGKQKDKFNKDILFYLIDRDYKKYTEWGKMSPRKNKY